MMGLKHVMLMSSRTCGMVDLFSEPKHVEWDQPQPGRRGGTNAIDVVVLMNVYVKILTNPVS